MLHQDGSTHEWVTGQHWDLVITLDDATSEHYSMCFVEEEGTASSFQGGRRNERVVRPHRLRSGPGPANEDTPTTPIGPGSSQKIIQYAGASR